MKARDTFAQFVLDQLAEIPDVEARAMFGGHGLYAGGVFFAILHEGRLYLKTDAAGRKAFEAAGMGPFRPNRRQTLRAYYEVPAEVLQSPKTLAAWARRSIRAAERPPGRGA